MSVTLLFYSILLEVSFTLMAGLVASFRNIAAV